MVTLVKYQQIYTEIKARIESQQYSNEEKLPDGKALANEFDCSEITLKKALDLLVKEGLVVRKRGSGSFVKNVDKASIPSSHLLGTKQRYQNTGKTIATKVVKFIVVKANAEIVNKLHCPIDTPVYEIQRVRIIDGVPSIIEHTYMPVNVVPNLTIEAVKNSIYDYIRDKLNLNIHSANLTITAAMATKLESELLAISCSDYLINVGQVAYLDNGQLFEYSVAKHTCDSFRMTTTYVRQ